MLSMDWPPLWLACAIALVRAMDRVVPFGVFGAAGAAVAAVLAGAGLMLMGLAAVQMWAARTTVIPRRMPQAMVTGGVFRLSRNPIYLGDALILTAAILWWDVPLALPVLFLFIAVIQKRFILPEEAALRSRFGASYDQWTARVRRWI